MSPIRKKYNFKSYIIIVLAFLVPTNSTIFCQNEIKSNSLSLPYNKILNNLKIFHDFNEINSKPFSVYFKNESVINSGHPNIDNNGEFYSPSKTSTITSFRFSLYKPWMFFEIEPYTISHFNFIEDENIGGSMSVNNNHSVNIPKQKNRTGFKQSRLIIHYKGLGIGYGKSSHWWGPGFHSSIALSSNAPSQETISIGSFKDIKFGNYSFGSKIIAMPYKNQFGSQIYFTGLKSHIKLNYKTSIFTLGFHRTYLSGDFNNLSSATINTKSWTLSDALSLVSEPLFGQSKKGLDYTIDGTPGYDYWDELLSVFVNMNFIEDNLDIYFEVASDDNRGNFVDLRSHWDHTLGYLFGAKKLFKKNSDSYLIGFEYLSTKISNTFNPKFYRGDPNSINYYTKQRYDYFSFEGRRMGAHSGSSSDDLIFMFGIARKNNLVLLSYNYERHGIKSMDHPELKSEIAVSFQSTISNNSEYFINFENERVYNYSYKENNVSISRIIWLGYTYSF